MILTQHTVRRYRNIAEASFEPGSDLTVICGKNGQGKTNLLESIWLLSGAKSFRGSKDADLIKAGETFAEITSTAVDEKGEHRFRLVIGGANAEKKGRFAQLNGVDYGKASNLAGHFYAVVFAPNHLSLIKGSPEERRRFLDAALCQLYPGYLSLWRRYARALTQKNALLKDARRFSGLTDLLDSFDEELAVCGASLIRYRMEYVSGLFPDACQNYASISDESEVCTFSYCPTAEQEPALREAIAAARTADLKMGYGTVGPHREDISVFIGKTDARVFASQGQQRSAVLSLKLAEASRIEAVTGHSPVILLDDVLSELDRVRQDYLLGRIEGRQVFITSCDPSLFSQTSGAVYQMEAGRLSPLE